MEYFNLNNKTIDIESISMMYLLENSWHLYLGSCGTYSQKATTNNLFRSKIDDTKNLKLKKCSFGWKDIGAIFIGDEKCVTRINTREQMLCIKNSLDDFTMMNANYAWQPFTSNTMSEVLSYFPSSSM